MDKVWHNYTMKYYSNENVSSKFQKHDIGQKKVSQKKGILYDSTYVKFKTGKTNLRDKSQSSDYLGRIMTGMRQEGSFQSTNNALLLAGNYIIMFTL